MVRKRVIVANIVETVSRKPVARWTTAGLDTGFIEAYTFQVLATNDASNTMSYTLTLEEHEMAQESAREGYKVTFDEPGLNIHASDRELENLYRAIKAVRKARKRAFR